MKSGNDYGWAGTLLDYSGDKFGDFEKTKTTDWLALFVEMSRQMDTKQKEQ